MKFLILFFLSATSAFAHPQHEAEHQLMRETAAAAPTQIAVFTGSIPAGNAQAHLNLKNNQCEITVGTERAAPHLSKFYRAALWPKFFAYHETAHCVLYSQQAQLTGQDNLTAREHAFLQDFLALHYIKIDEDVHGGDNMNNMNVTFHEMFADSLAILMLLRDGIPKDDLKFIRDMRQATAFGSSHDTVKAIDRIMGMASTPTDMTEMVAMAKQMALVSAFERLSLGKPSGNGSTYLVGPQTVSLIKNVYNQSIKSALHTHDYMIVDYETLDNLDNYPAVKHSLSISKTAAKYSEREFLEVWIKTKYELDFVEWQMQVEKLSAKLEQLSISK